MSAKHFRYLACLGLCALAFLVKAADDDKLTLLSLIEYQRQNLIENDKVAVSSPAGMHLQASLAEAKRLVGQGKVNEAVVLYQQAVEAGFPSQLRESRSVFQLGVTLNALKSGKQILAGEYDIAFRYVQQLAADLARAEASPASGRAIAARFLLASNFVDVIALAQAFAYSAPVEILELDKARRFYLDAMQSPAAFSSEMSEINPAITHPMASAAAIVERVKNRKSLELRKDTLSALMLDAQALWQRLSFENQADSPRGLALRRGYDDWVKARDAYLANETDAGDKLTSSGLRKFFVSSENGWDADKLPSNGILIHRLHLVVALEYLKSRKEVSIDDKRTLSTAYKELVNTEDSAEYQTRAEKLKTLILGVVEKAELKTRDPDFLLHFSPSKARVELASLFNGLRSPLLETKEYLRRSRGFIARLSGNADSSELKALSIADDALRSFSVSSAHTDSLFILTKAYRGRMLVRLIDLYVIEAAGGRFKTANGFAHVLLDASNRLGEGSLHLVDANTHQRLKTLNNQQTNQQIFRAWVNRENAKVAALGTLLVAEAVSIPFSGGSSAAVMPATLHLITTVSVAAAKTVLVATSALNIADRASIQGKQGLLSMDSGFDALVILSLTPRVVPLEVTAKSSIGRMGQTLRNKVGFVQYDAARLMTWGLPLYSGYLYLKADQISADMAREGIGISASEIRRKAMLNLAFAVVSGIQNHRFFEANKARFKGAFEKPMAGIDKTPGGEIRKVIGLTNPYQAALRFSEAHPGVLGKAAGSMIALGYATYDYVLLSEAMLLSFATPDFVYQSAIESQKPLPALKDDETAVAVIGFDRQDLLYLGAHAEHAHRREQALYGNRYSLYDFDSPEHLMDVLSEHAKKKGPIRYLKIMTHGRPGRLFTKAVHLDPHESLDEATSGWIDAEWLSKNRERVLQRSKEIFAPDARVVLFACLVGANLRRSQDGDPTNVGDQFLRAFGDAFLPKGGRVDSSTRILEGLDTVFGSAIETAAENGFRAEEGRAGKPYPLVPVLEFVPRSVDGLYALAPAVSEQSEDAMSTLAFLIYGSERLGHLILKMPVYAYKYGINLEGPWWINAHRYKSLEFPLHN